VVRVAGLDNYTVDFALAEFAPAVSDRSIVLAERQDGGPLPENALLFRLVIPGDEHPARWVRQVNTRDFFARLSCLRWRALWLPTVAPRNANSSTTGWRMGLGKDWSRSQRRSTCSHRRSFSRRCARGRHHDSGAALGLPDCLMFAGAEASDVRSYRFGLLGWGSCN
jgi:hypothetical protein